MENKELKAEDIPMGYPLCFNKECAEKEKSNCTQFLMWNLVSFGEYGNGCWNEADR